MPWLDFHYQLSVTPSAVAVPLGSIDLEPWLHADDGGIKGGWAAAAALALALSNTQTGRVVI